MCAITVYGLVSCFGPIFGPVSFSLTRKFFDGYGISELGESQTDNKMSDSRAFGSEAALQLVVDLDDGIGNLPHTKMFSAESDA